ncbi:MAG: hypothetical protein ACJZ1Q_00290 [Candidatus Neomarinimicrobiota bacterium]
MKYMVLKLGLFLFILFGQKLGNPKEIYKDVYQTAILDGNIDNSEKVMLGALQVSLQLSDIEIYDLKINDERIPINTINSKQGLVLNKSGRWPLVAQNMAWGVGLYGWGIPYILDADDFKWFIGTQMISLGGAFYFTYNLTRTMEISHSRSHMFRAGSVLGFRYGWGINTLLDLWKRGDPSKSSITVLMASVPVGSYAGDFVYKKYNPTNGQAWGMTILTELTSYTIRQFHHIIDTKPENDYYYASNYDELDTLSYRNWLKRHTLIDFVSYPIGLYLSHNYVKNKSYTFGDGIMLLQGRTVGWIYGLLLNSISDIDFEDSSARISRVALSIGGTYLLDNIIKDKDYTFGQSVLTILGTASGMAFGLGSAVIMEIDDGWEPFMMVGGLAGLYFSNSILDVKSETSLSNTMSKSRFSLIPNFQVLNSNLSGYNTKKIIPSIYLNATFW